MRCGGSVAAERGLVDNGSKYAAEGTAAHELASKCLEFDADATALIGDTITVGQFEFTVTADMAGHVNDYCKLVREYAQGGQLLVERRVDFSDVIGVPDSTGTSDAIIIHPDRITVVDLKYGMGERVDATENEQLQMYALGAVHDYGMLGDFIVHADLYGENAIGLMVRRQRTPRSARMIVPTALRSTRIPYSVTRLESDPRRMIALATPVMTTTLMDKSAMDEYRRRVSARCAPDSMAMMLATRPPVHSETKTMCMTRALIAMPWFAVAPE
jgi:hypothetical protein